MDKDEEIIIEKERIEITPKAMGKDFKKFIKNNSEDYLERLKAEINKNLKIYYEVLNKQISEEQSEQEKLQKELDEQMKEKQKENDEIYKRLSRRKQILLREKEFKYKNDLKVKGFISLYKNMIEEREENKITLSNELKRENVK